MNTNRDLFLENCKFYFEDDYEKFVSLMNDKTKSAFFLNTKKANKKDILSIIDFPYSKSDLTNSSFYHNSDSIGKSKAYELGLIYPQDIESSLPTSYVDCTNVKHAIDLCAAPGGKSINILNKLNDDSLLVSNDVSSSRASVLSYNLERLGLDRTIVTSDLPSKIAEKFKNCFDLVILDAPCSGEGMIRKYPEILDTYSNSNIDSLAKLQKELLENAYDLLKVGGQLLYSTCTYSFNEDENQIVDFLHSHDDMRLIELDINTKNFSKLNGTIKLSCLNNTEGQFMCLMSKTKGFDNKLKYLKTIKNNIVGKFIVDNIDIDNYYLYQNDNKFYLSLIPLIETNLHVLRQGIFLGEIIKNRFEPAHSLYRSNSLKNKFKYTLDLNDKQYLDFISGNELKINLNDNYYQTTYKSHSLGYGKLSKGILKNKYPKGLRKLK